MKSPIRLVLKAGNVECYQIFSVSLYDVPKNKCIHLWYMKQQLFLYFFLSFLSKIPIFKLIFHFSVILFCLHGTILYFRSWIKISRSWFTFLYLYAIRET